MAGTHRRRRSRIRYALLLAAALILGGTGAAMASGGPPVTGPAALRPGGASDFRGHHARVPNLAKAPDCTLRVPENPLSAQGLATPYVLHSAGAACAEANADTAAFVQATILDPATGQVSVYDPVIRDAGRALQGAAPPVPVLPPGAVVTVWTGFNGNVLKLTGPGRRAFVNFPQQAYANSPGFFAALNAAVRSGKTAVPALGTSPKDGLPCPTTRDFSVADQDQSDNNPQSYPAYGVGNASDEKTLDAIDTALGCVPWKAPLLDPAVAGGAAVSPSGPLQEAQAAADQGAPVALIPGGDPFTFAGGQPSLFLQNLLRLQVDQPFTGNNNDTAAYCQNLAAAGEPRLKLDAPVEAMFPATLPLGNNLASQLANRFVMTWANLGCAGPSPVTVTLDANGTAVAAAYR